MSADKPRDARDVAHEIVAELDACIPALNRRTGHSSYCDKSTGLVEAIIADRAARPDVERMRWLLEEGAKAVDRAAESPEAWTALRRWARQVREALGPTKETP